MDKRLRIFRVDAFTERPFAGNPAAVVMDAEGLTTERMRAIAREQGGVDTAFVLPANGADHDLQVRFFTPHGEAGFIGHATLATHAVLEALGRPPAPRQRQRAGLVQVERLGGDAAAHGYAFSQPPPPLGNELPSTTLAALLEALGLDSDALDARLPALIAGSSSTRALVALRSGDALARIKPDLAALAALSASGGPAGWFLYTLAPALADCDTEARMFCPAIGIAEDPVSGNAHAMLACRLHAAGRWPANAPPPGFTGRQGHHVGRPGSLQVRLELADAAVRSVRVAGAASLVMESVLEAPGIAACGAGEP
jgi:PhzF family phenazine biosynthesis protein